MSEYDWRVYRLDDNGNRFAVGDYQDRQTAEAVAAAYAAKGHKQAYWVEPVTRPGTAAASRA